MVQILCGQKRMRTYIDNEPLLIEQLIAHAHKQPTKVALRFLHADYQGKTELTYAELLTQIKELAGAIQSQKSKKPVLLLFEAGVEYIVAFLATLMAGRIAVTAYPPRKTHHQVRLLKIMESSKSDLILATQATRDYCVRNGFAFPEDSKFWATDNLDVHGAYTPYDAKPTDIALLQYTSGSTGDPKGVMVTQGNIRANTIAMQNYYTPAGCEVCVSWVPIFHDMGLFGSTLLPLYTGGTVVSMAPTTFLKKPHFWLQAISEYAGTITMAPNFAYDLILASLDSSSTLDLSSLQHMLNGAEAVRPETIKALREKLSPFGLSTEAIKPSYGLAEATLAVTSFKKPINVLRLFSEQAFHKGYLQEPSAEETTLELVRCGHVLEGFCEVKIVAPETLHSLPVGHIGEIWVRGLMVTEGYFGRAEETAKVFRASTTDAKGEYYLRTGDLGAVDEEGYLYVCGRIKDVMIINGRNVYPQDIESSCYAAHPSVIANGSSAFSLSQGGEERIIVVAEVKRHLSEDEYTHIARLIRRAVYENQEVTLHGLVFIPPKTLPKTSSGKIQRSLCKAKYLAKELRSMYEWETKPITDPAGIVAENSGSLMEWMAQYLAHTLSIERTSVDTELPFADYGLDSVQQMQFLKALESRLKRSLDPWLLWQCPNIAALAEYCTRAEASSHTKEQLRTYDPVAVIGMGCRFPRKTGEDIETVEGLWAFLLGDEDAIRPTPKDRWNTAALRRQFGELPGLDQGAFLRHIKRFDAAFFNISPREASMLDPQQRLSLEVIWHALENANIAPDTIRDTNTAIYLGISTHDYEYLLQKSPALKEFDTYQATGNSFATAAGRLAYFLGTHGPCMAIDTACSSSLVGIHQAARALQEHETDLAIAGGVNVILSPEINVIFAKSGMLSPNYRCRTFDKDADGYVRGEGAAMVVLKRLDDAIRDGNRIYAVLKGSAVNQDGASNGLTAPNLNAQMQVMQMALQMANCEPAQITHIEAHGTGTALGDPIEWEGIKQVYARDRNLPLYVSSIKTRFGHLEAAAGVTGFMKAALALYNRTIPAHLNFQEYNTNITPLHNVHIPTKTTELGDAMGFAAISSFGFSGTNAHAVLGHAPPSRAQSNANDKGPRLWVVSAKDEKHLEAYRDIYSAWLPNQSEEAFASICYYSLYGRSHLPARAAIVAQNLPDLRKALAKLEHGFQSSVQPKIALLFTGQGSLTANAAHGLYTANSYFAKQLDKVSALAEGLLPHSLKTLLVDTPESVDIRDTAIAQPALFAYEYALANTWLALGVRPVALLGHSLGEYVAAALSGVMSLPDAIRLVCVRAKLMGALPKSGSMLAVQASRDILTDILFSLPELALAAHNSPEQGVLSGDNAAIKRAQQWCERQGIPTKVLATSHAFHSPLMQAMVEDFRAEAAHIKYQAPRIPIISNLTGMAIDENSYTAEYWCQHILSPVEFYQGLQSLQAFDVNIVLEVGPAAVLSPLAQQAGFLHSIYSVCKSASAYRDMLQALGQLYCLGLRPHWEVISPRIQSDFVNLPLYPFHGETYWFQSPNRTRELSIYAEYRYKTVWERIKLREHAKANINKTMMVLAPPGFIDKASDFALQAGLSLQTLNFALPFPPQAALVFVCADDPASMLAQAQRFYHATHFALTEHPKTPFIVITQPESPVGAAFVSALQSIRREHPTWPAQAVFVKDISESLLWALLAQAPTSTGELLQIVDDALYRETLIREADWPETVRHWSDSVCLVTGATGFLGQYLIEQMLTSGVKHVVALGRQVNPEAFYEHFAKAIQEKRLTYLNCDLSLLHDVKKALQEAAKNAPPITLVLHAAGVLQDKLWLQVSEEEWLSMLRMKALGAWNLHHACADLPLQDFILLSSLASVLGSDGQAAYAAANGFLCGLAKLRAAKGLPAWAIALGPVRHSVMVEGSAGLAEKMQEYGLGYIDKEDIWDLLSRSGPNESVTVYADLQNYKQPISLLEDKNLIHEPLPVKEISEETDLGELLTESVKQVLKLGANFILEKDKNWFTLGMDSIMAGQLAFAINKKLPGLALSSKDIFQYSDVNLLRAFIKERAPKSSSTELPEQPIISGHTLPLSLQQQEVWNYLKTTSNSKAYYIPMQIRFSGKFDLAQFADSIKSIMQKHDVFHYAFDEVLGQASIYVQPEITDHIEIIEQFDKDRVQAFFVEPLLYDEAPLARFMLIQESEDSFLWFALFHHLIMDGQSMKIFVYDVLAQYSGKEHQSINLRYADYITWQREQFLHAQQHDFKPYWIGVLEQYPVDVPVVKNTGLPMEAAVMTHKLSLTDFTPLQNTLASEQVTLSNAMLQILADVVLKKFKRDRQGIVVFFSGREEGIFLEVIGDVSNDVVVCLESSAGSDRVVSIKILQNQLISLADRQYFRIQLLKDNGILPMVSYDFQTAEQSLYDDGVLASEFVSFWNAQPELWGNEPRCLSFKVFQTEAHLYVSLKYRRDKIEESLAKHLLDIWVEELVQFNQDCMKDSYREPVLARGSASVLQRNLWNAMRDWPDTDNNPYVLPIIRQLVQQYNPAILQQALTNCIQANAALRTSFEYDDTRGLQYLLQRDADVTIEYIHARNIYEGIGNLLAGGVQHTSAPLLEAWVIQAPGSPDILFLKASHLVLDGLSGEILLQKLEQQYEALEQGVEIVSVPDDQFYLERIYEEKRAYPSRRDNQAAYYQSIAPLVSSDKDTRSHEQIYYGGVIFEQFPSVEQVLLEQYCEKYHLQPYAVYLQVFADTIREFQFGQEVCAISLVRSNRSALTTTDALGYFADNVPVAVQTSSEQFIEQAHKTQGAILEALKNNTQTILTEELSLLGYRQPDFIFNHYHIAKGSALFQSAESIIASLISQNENIPLWNYTQPELLNFAVRHTDEGDSLGLVFDIRRIDRDLAKRVLSSIKSRIIGLINDNKSL